VDEAGKNAATCGMTGSVSFGIERLEQHGESHSCKSLGLKQVGSATCKVFASAFGCELLLTERANGRQCVGEGSICVYVSRRSS
jgi:hypothetical protein